MCTVTPLINQMSSKNLVLRHKVEWGQPQQWARAGPRQQRAVGYSVRHESTVVYRGWCIMVFGLVKLNSLIGLYWLYISHKKIHIDRPLLFLQLHLIYYSNSTKMTLFTFKVKVKCLSVDVRWVISRTSCHAFTGVVCRCNLTANYWTIPFRMCLFWSLIRLCILSKMYIH